MKIGVVAVPWEAHRNALFSVCAWARTWKHELSVRTDLVNVPAWARSDYARWPEPLPAVDVLVWMAPGTPPPAPWVLLEGTEVPPDLQSRWSGRPSEGSWERTDGTAPGSVLVVEDLEAWMHQLSNGRAAWPPGHWSGPVLPGRTCPSGWWSPARTVRLTTVGVFI